MARSDKGTFVIQSFKFGLDSRRSELTSQPGTLARLVNGHVNQGAEIQKRKAFIKSGSSDTFGLIGSTLPYGTYGLLATPLGLLTFGSKSLASLLTATVTVSPIGGAVSNGDGTGYVTANYPVPGSRIVVGSTIHITGTGLGFDGTTVTITNVAYNYTSMGFEQYGFNTGASGGSSLTGSFVLTNAPSALPTPFYYQQLTDPNTGFTGFQITQIVPSLKTYGIVGWSINGFTFNNQGAVLILGTSLGFVVGARISISGTGNSFLDSNTFLIIQIAITGIYTELIFQVSALAPAAAGNSGTITYYSPIAIQLTISNNTLPAQFVVGSTFLVYGLTNPALLIYNGTQTALSITVSGSNTLVTIAGSLAATYTGSPLGDISIGTNITNAMTGVIAACLFNGLPFVIVAYDGGDYGIYYNQQLVNDFFNGEVFSNATSNANLAVQLANYLNATTGYTSQVNGSTVICTSVNPSDITKVTPGGTFSIVPANMTASGTMTITPISSAVAPVIGEQAQAAFTINAVDTTNGATITAVRVNDFSGTDTNLLTSDVTVAGGSTPTQLAAALVTAINTDAQIVGVTAQANGSTVTVTLPSGSAYNDSVLQVVVKTASGSDIGAACIDLCYVIVNGGAAGSLVYTTAELKINGTALLSSTVSQSGGTTLAFVKALITNINRNAATSGYCAALGPQVGNSCYLYLSRATTQSGAASLTLTSSPTGNGTVTAALTNASFQAKLSVASVSSNTNGITTVGGVPTASVTARPVGGVGPFTYQWNLYSGSAEIAINSPQKPATNFIASVITVAPTTSLSTGQSNSKIPTGIRYIANLLTAKFTCTITDTGNSNIVAVSAPVTVTAAYITAVTSSSLGTLSSNQTVVG